MAKISAHGKIIGTVEFLTSAKRYMSDGTILKNIGFGWKLAGKIKPGATPAERAAAQVAHQAAWREANPHAAAYKAMLHELCGLNKRWKLHAAVQMMPDDPDGVWSEACDGYGDNVHADIDDVVKLCMLYRLAIGDKAKLAA